MSEKRKINPRFLLPKDVQYEEEYWEEYESRTTSAEPDCN